MDDGIRNPDGSFTLAYLAYLVNTARRKKRRKAQMAVAPVNLAAPFPWVQGASTIMTVNGTRMRYTKDGANPRIWKQITGLQIGADYRIQAQMFKGTQTGAMILRWSATTGLPSGDLGQSTNDFSFDGITDATASTMFLGVVAIATANGEYAEILADIIVNQV